MQKKTVFNLLFPSTLVAIFFFISFKVLNERNYMLLSFLLLLFALSLVIFLFEKKEVKISELVLICVFSSIGILGRVAFFAFPQIKPMAAIIILAGALLDSKDGFIVGLLCAFLSNFFFGQGMWTLWQMLSFGLIGFFSGVIFKKVPLNKLSSMIIGFILVIFIYGVIINFSSVLMYSNLINMDSIKAVYLTGLPFDILHGISTSIFLLFLTDGFRKKINRIKEKYGIMNLN